MWISRKNYEAMCDKIYYLQERECRQLKHNACEKCMGCKHLLFRETIGILGGTIKDYYCKLNNECDDYAEQ